MKILGNFIFNHMLGDIVMAKVIMISSGKGGTGKTMFASNIAVILADRGNKTLLVDMVMGFRNLDIYLGLENNIVYDLYDVMTGVCDKSQALLIDKRVDNLHFIAASPAHVQNYITKDQISDFINNVRDSYDYVIIDSPSGTGNLNTLLVQMCDEIIVVTSPDYASLRDSDAFYNYIRGLKQYNCRFVVNNTILSLIEAGYMVPIDNIINYLKCEIIGIIQYDDNIRVSTNMGEPITLNKKNYIRDNFDKIVRHISPK